MINSGDLYGFCSADFSLHLICTAFLLSVQTKVRTTELIFISVSIIVKSVSIF